jgi:hypothetical protein
VISASHFPFSSSKSISLFIASVLKSSVSRL